MVPRSLLAATCLYVGELRYTPVFTAILHGGGRALSLNPQMERLASKEKGSGGRLLVWSVERGIWLHLGTKSESGHISP